VDAVSIARSQENPGTILVFDNGSMVLSLTPEDGEAYLLYQSILERIKSHTNAI